MNHVFISYKHEIAPEKRLFVDRLKYRIKGSGLEVWMDNDIPAGEEWRDQIKRALQNAFAVVVVMSPEAKTSEYVTHEWSFALGMGIKVVPIIQETTPLPSPLEHLQFLDFTGKRPPWRTLIERLQHIKDEVNFQQNQQLHANEPFVTEVEAILNRPNTISDMLYAIMVETYRNAGQNEVTTDQIINMLGFNKLLALDKQALLLTLIHENRRNAQRKP